MKRVEIEFADSNIMHGWADPEICEGLAYATVAGYQVFEDDDMVIVSMAMSKSGLVFEVLTIPKAAILSKRELRVK